MRETFSTTCVNNTPHLETKTIDKEGFSIEYPKNWSEKDVPNYLIFLIEPESKEQDFITTIGIQQTSSNISLDKFCENYENDMSSSNRYKSFEVKSKSEMNYGGQKAIRYYSTAEASHLPVEIISIVSEKEGKIILVTAIAFWFNITESTGKFTELKNKAEKILNSIKVE